MVKKCYEIGLPYSERFLFGTTGRSGLGIEVKQTNDNHNIYFDTQLWGVSPSWQDVISALVWDNNSIGPEILTIGKDEHESRNRFWRLDSKVRRSGAIEYFIRLKDDIADKYNTAGKISAHLHISCNNKLNEGINKMLLADFYLFYNCIPCVNIEEIREIYANMPPRELAIYDGKWFSPKE